MAIRHLNIAACLLALGAACTVTDNSATDTGASSGSGDDGMSIEESECEMPVGTCGSVVCQHPNEGAKHEMPCAPLSFDQNPPTSGTHYAVWADFKVYPQQISRGFWVHSMEHGAVVLAYNCDLYDGDCAELETTLADFKSAWPQDEKCSETTKNRLLVTPDPLLEVPFAAVAWDWSLTASCFDADEVSDFIDAHYAQTYEDICTTGLDPLDPDPGYQYPSDCP